MAEVAAANPTTRDAKRTRSSRRMIAMFAMAVCAAVSTMGLTGVAALASPIGAGTGSSAVSPSLVPMRTVSPLSADSIFISEIHYENVGTDVGEFVEVQGPVGTDLTGWNLTLYNGGNPYGGGALPTPIGDSGVVVLDYPENGIQNGDPDGVALLDADGAVVEFLSYEGTITATGGAAVGIDSTDIGVSETTSTPIGQSLQRIDGVWTGPSQNTKGAINDPPQSPVELVTIGELNANFDNGATARTRGVVTARYAVGGFNGYVIQTGGTGGDTDLSARTASDAIFVFSPATVDEVAIGDHVEVEGQLYLYLGQRELDTDAVTVLTESAEPVLPIQNFIMPSDETARMAFQHMLVVPTGYVVSDTFDLGGWGDNTFGSILLGHGGPLVQESDVAQVGSADFDATVADNEARAVSLDDGRSERTGNGVVPYLASGSHDVRTGVELIFDAPVIVDYRLGWNFQPTSPQMGPADWLRTVGGNTRAANVAPADVGGDLQLATFNVRNYFTTLGDAVPGCSAQTDRDGNPLTVSGGCDPRGAWDVANLERQQGKIVAAINGLDAEVVALQDIENTAATIGDPMLRDESLGLLVEALNADAGSGTWAYVPSPDPAQQPALADQNLTRPGLIYRTDAVAAVSPATTILDNAVFGNAHQPEASVFSLAANADYQFAVVTSHFTSRGGCDPAPADGCFAPERVPQAEAMATFADEYADTQGVNDVFLAGDFNSFTMESPILAFADAGFAVIDTGETSYLSDGKIGSLDHVLVNDSAMARVTGSDVWRINAGESVLNGYSRYNFTESQLFEADSPFRSSDHNPVLVGIDVPDYTPPDETPAGESGIDKEAPKEIANTGNDPGILPALGLALLVAGASLALRRRARS